MKVILPETVAFILKTLKDAGHKAYVVGGCVRDSIMGRDPQDWDIATDALPENVKGLFSKTVDTGIAHGTVTVVIHQQHFEVTTFRVDGAYRDGRHPDQVNFVSSVSEDLGRRDFTCNAMAYNQEEGIVDPYDGTGDIDGKVIRAVGQPGTRFREDGLRMLRAVRFSAQLDFEIEAGTFEAIQKNNTLIAGISQERIRDELTKILMSAHPEKFRLLRDCGLLGYIMPEFEPCFDTAQNHPYHVHNVAEHILYAVSRVENKKTLRWAALLHDIGKPFTKTTDERGIDHFYGHPEKSVAMAKHILERLRFDKDFTKAVTGLIRFHDRKLPPAARDVRRALSVIGAGLFEDLLYLQAADMKAQNPDFLAERLKILEEVRKIYLQIVNEHQCISMKDLAVNGHDLIAIGFEPGLQLRQVLKKLMDVCLEDPSRNNHSELMELAKRFKKEYKAISNWEN